MLHKKRISPRYCEEDISYLKVKEHKSVAIPMKCFCDIAITKLGFHMEWYGNYGIAFPKVWGKKHGLQQVQYLNDASALRYDMTEALNASFKSMGKKCGVNESILRNYLLHELMYYKPYQGKMKKRTTGKMETKCLADECEWRYIPSVGHIEGMPTIMFSHFDRADDYSDALASYDEVALPFEYSEIKHIIIRDLVDYQNLITAIEGWSLSDTDKYTILSRIIVWDDTREDL